MVRPIPSIKLVSPRNNAPHMMLGRPRWYWRRHANHESEKAETAMAMRPKNSRTNEYQGAARSTTTGDPGAAGME
eukprot:684165-Rhodomonas_salina.1